MTDPGTAYVLDLAPLGSFGVRREEVAATRIRTKLDILAAGLGNHLLEQLVPLRAELKRMDLAGVAEEHRQVARLVARRGRRINGFCTSDRRRIEHVGREARSFVLEDQVTGCVRRMRCRENGRRREREDQEVRNVLVEVDRARREARRVWARTGQEDEGPAGGRLEVGNQRLGRRQVGIDPGVARNLVCAKVEGGSEVSD